MKSGAECAFRHGAPVPFGAIPSLSGLSGLRAFRELGAIMDRAAHGFRRDWEGWSAWERWGVAITVVTLLPILVSRLALLLA